MGLFDETFSAKQRRKATDATKVARKEASRPPATSLKDEKLESSEPSSLPSNSKAKSEEHSQAGQPFEALRDQAADDEPSVPETPAKADQRTKAVATAAIAKEHSTTAKGVKNAAELAQAEQVQRRVDATKLAMATERARARKRAKAMSKKRVKAEKSTVSETPAETGQAAKAAGTAAIVKKQCTTAKGVENAHELAQTEQVQRRVEATKLAMATERVRARKRAKAKAKKLAEMKKRADANQAERTTVAALAESAPENAQSTPTSDKALVPTSPALRTPPSARRTPSPPFGRADVATVSTEKRIKTTLTLFDETISRVRNFHSSQQHTWTSRHIRSAAKTPGGKPEKRLRSLASPAGSPTPESNLELLDASNSSPSSAHLEKPVFGQADSETVPAQSLPKKVHRDNAAGPEKEIPKSSSKDARVLGLLQPEHGQPAATIFV